MADKRTDTHPNTQNSTYNDQPTVAAVSCNIVRYDGKKEPRMEQSCQIQHQHSYAPGRLALVGQRKPAEIVTLLNAAEAAEEWHLAVADRYEEGRATQDELTEAEETAEAAEKTYLEAREEWAEYEADAADNVYPWMN